jgi:hypothetical protein
MIFEYCILNLISVFLVSRGDTFISFFRLIVLFLFVDLYQNNVPHLMMQILISFHYNFDINI